MMRSRRDAAVLLMGLTLLQGVALGTTLDAPNAVEISRSLITSGQPSRAALARLNDIGVQAVIYLAPSSVSDAVKDEPELLKQQGIEFVHIPIPFMDPTQEHVVAVTRALQRLKDKKVLVHCQVNLRASVMVFMHRVITLREEPTRAYEAVSRVWSPEGPWRTLLVEQLKKHGINFQPL
jgi:protein tyrosine phosphatase (PTP) superfamily phosphohydrolase (DUF442 family)